MLSSILFIFYMVLFDIINQNISNNSFDQIMGALWQNLIFFTFRKTGDMCRKDFLKVDMTSFQSVYDSTCPPEWYSLPYFWAFGSRTN